jgi:hypothetical protein
MKNPLRIRWRACSICIELFQESIWSAAAERGFFVLTNQVFA